MHHYWQSMGNWTFMFNDYWQLEIPTYLGGHPALQPLLDLIDPYGETNKIS